MTKLSDTALTILNAGAQREDRVAHLPAKLPAAARNAVARNLVKQGLLEEVDGGTLHLTDAGFRELGLEPRQDAATATAARSEPYESGERDQGILAQTEDTALYGPQKAAMGMATPKLLDALQTVLVAWDMRETQPENLALAIDQLQALMATKPARTRRDPNTPRKQREGTKQQTVLGLLRRSEGATIAQIVATTAWAQHTVRGFLANLKRKGITVDVLERVRQVGPGSTGTTGSYSIYRIADAG